MIPDLCRARRTWNTAIPRSRCSLALILAALSLIGSETRVLADETQQPHSADSMFLPALRMHWTAPRCGDNAYPAGAIWITGFLQQRGVVWDVSVRFKEIEAEKDEDVLVCSSSICFASTSPPDLTVRGFPTSRAVIDSLPDTNLFRVGREVEETPIANVLVITRFDTEQQSNTWIVMSDKLPAPLATLHKLMIAKASERIDKHNADATRDKGSK